MSNVNMEATTILPVLKKKLAFLSGKNKHTNYEINDCIVSVWSVIRCVPSLMVYL